MANPKRKIVKKVASFIKSRANSTDNMTRGPIDKAINKKYRNLGEKKYRKAEDAMLFHLSDNNPNHYVNAPKMSQNTAEKILFGRKNKGK